MKWAKKWWNLEVYGKNLKRDVKYITRDSVCLYNEVDKEEEILFFYFFYNKKKGDLEVVNLGTVWN